MFMVDFGFSIADYSFNPQFAIHNPQ